MNNELYQFYCEVSQSLQDAGAKAAFQDEDQLVISTGFPHFPDSTNSFWLTHNERRWYLVTWAPRVYEIPRYESVLPVSLECLGASATAISAVPDHIIKKFQLRLLSDAEATSILNENR